MNRPAKKNAIGRLFISQVSKLIVHLFRISQKISIDNAFAATIRVYYVMCVRYISSCNAKRRHLLLHVDLLISDGGKPCSVEA